MTSRRNFELFKIILAVYTFAVTAPLLEKFRAEPDFFVTQRISAVMLVVFALTVALAIPGIFAAAIFYISRLTPRLGNAVYFFATWLLTSAFILPYITAEKIKTIRALEYGCAGGLVLAIFIFSIPALSRFVAFLAPAFILFIGLFLGDSGIRQSILAGDGKVSISSHGDSTPIVLVVFDELPLSGLLSSENQIDEQLFPNFVALAQQSTWYRGAKAVSTHTALALPAILSGKYPNPEKKSPTFRNHPNNLFTLLGATHTPVVLERVSSLCPPDICGTDQRGITSKFSELLMDSLAVYLRILLPRDRLFGFPDINTNWGGFWTKASGSQNRDDWKRLGRIRLFQEMLSKIVSPSPKPLLLFAHHLMPHMPYQWTKELRLYPADEFPEGYVNDNWQGNDWQIQQAYQRFLVQVQAADTILGGYIQKLKDSGLWDKALVIVTADHGVTFEKSAHRRGNIESLSFEYDLMSIPLFVKRPAQKNADTNQLIAQSIDILPTIAKSVAADVTWDFDGIPLDSSKLSERRLAKLMIGKKRHQSKLKEENRAYDSIELTPSSRPDSTVTWKQEKFGAATFLYGGPFGIAPSPELRRLIGRQAKELAKGGQCTPEIRLLTQLPQLGGNSLKLYKNEQVSSFIQGEFLTNCIMPLAFDLNGDIVAITQAGGLKSKSKRRGIRFSALLPEQKIFDNETLRVWGIINNAAVPVRFVSND
jgi:hypothetical protein